MTCATVSMQREFPFECPKTRQETIGDPLHFPKHFPPSQNQILRYILQLSGLSERCVFGTVMHCDVLYKTVCHNCSAHVTDAPKLTFFFVNKSVPFLTRFRYAWIIWKNANTNLYFHFGLRTSHFLAYIFGPYQVISLVK